MYNILALPRSRTYWLSRFLSTDTCEFLHEGMGDITLNVIGNASTIPLRETDPEKTLIIERDFGEVIQSLKKLFPMPKGVEYNLELYQDELDSIEGYRIQFNEINENLDWIWEYIHGYEMDEIRAEIMMQENLQNHRLINQWRVH
jgi:hypothetical protein